MGYKNFQVPKTIYLPVPTLTITIQEYKNAYGIDLLDFFEIDDDTIRLKMSAFKNTNIYLVADGGTFSEGVGVYPVLEKSQSHYDENDPDSYASIICGVYIANNEELSGLSMALSHDDGLDITKAVVYLY